MSGSTAPVYIPQNTGDKCKEIFNCRCPIKVVNESLLQTEEEKLDKKRLGAIDSELRLPW